MLTGLVVAAAFYTGPSVMAVKTRADLVAVLGSLRSGVEQTGLYNWPVGQWTYVHRHALRIGAVGPAAIIFVFQSRLTAGSVIALVITLLVVLGLIELIGRPPTSPPARRHRLRGRESRPHILSR
jgi:hypothetical protein